LGCSKLAHRRVRKEFCHRNSKPQSDQSPEKRNFHAGAKEKPHSHPAYVIYVVKGGKVLNHAADGKTNEAEFKDGDVIYRDAIPQHWAENIGTTTMRLILVELKPGS